MPRRCPTLLLLATSIAVVAVPAVFAVTTAAASPAAIAAAPPREPTVEIRYPIGLMFETMDVSGLSMTIDSTDIEALEGHDLPELEGTRDFVGVSVGAEVLADNGLSAFMYVTLGGTGGDDTTEQVPIGAEGDMLNLDIATPTMMGTGAGAGYAVPVGAGVSLYMRGDAGVRSVSQAVDVSFMDSEIGSEVGADVSLSAGVQIGARARIGDDYDLWVAWNERLPRSSGLMVGVGYYYSR